MEAGWSPLSVFGSENCPEMWGLTENSVGGRDHLRGCSWEFPQGGPLELWLGRLGTRVKPGTASSSPNL